ncbi:MAG: EAL domain-containing protein [Candidatus Accumulibacter sp. UW26]|jgi:diguanylate cyclase (GGDEF)-like protein/PAS domain S-box-containing protein|uniref:EAL domain-containing protein n=2 Tax=Candidatus Accumulibacter TaxID=327159 RepID=A0ABX1TDA0_9PROT|nr:EAL domain-containing protein [Candidatus Accumulibacter contiguus]MBL8407465.1 EAL domain-containing protein [Accumulibacter sp.]NMQ07670.1 EAL domain-containing protein [Candidatus Accumulibacter contiguus]
MTRRAWRQLRTTFLLFLGVFVGGMVAMSAYTLWRLRGEAVANGLGIAAMHSRGFEDFLTQSLHVTELVAANSLAQVSLVRDAREIERTFVAALQHVPFLRSMSLLDDAGRIVASSNPANLGVTVATQNYLPADAGRLQILRIGEPWAGRDFASGQPSTAGTPVDADSLGFIPVTRSIGLGKGRVTLLFALNPDYFINHIAQKIAAEEGSVSVLRYDGTLLMDSDPGGRPGSLQDHFVSELRLAEVEFGQFEQGSGEDRPRLIAFRASRLYPFLVVTALDRRPALQQWRTETRTVLGVMVPALLAITLLATGLYRRQMQLAEQRAESERLQQINAASVFTNAREGIMITSPDGTILDVNEAFSRMSGFSREESLGQNPRFLRSGVQAKEFYTAMWGDLIGQGHWSGEVWNRGKSGEMFAAILTISAVRDDQGRTRQYVALFSDITLLKANEEKLKRTAHYDALTGLPNRVLLADRLHQGMMQTQRRGQRLTVAFLDLDGFKAVNDQHGHEAGDQLLMTVAGRMKQALREGDTLARLGGDEFVAVLLDLSDIPSCAPIVDRLIAASAQPVPYGEQILQVSTSVGVTFYPQAEEVDADQLLRQADQAMYQAKLAGKNRYCVFDAELDRSVRSHNERLEDIRRALLADEFVLHYQPRVNLRSGAVIGVEALIRWQHPEKGLLLPAAFLPLIENHPLAVDLGEWVIARALAQIAEWRGGGLEMAVSVNIGARQLQQAGFVERLRTLLAGQPEVGPGRLDLELRETRALKDLASVCAIITACRKIGVSFALDDFACGHSSLTYLKSLPVSRINIDRSFVCDLLEGGENRAVLEGVIGLAKAFHRQIVAEGVESIEQGQMLLQLGCESAQGDGIARPMPAADIVAWVAAWQSSPGALRGAALPSVSVPHLPIRA